ncbi:hypothetical protein, partial [Streptomyces sp. NPDC006324]|uniref:hypothetical protein n=1 Tax=Streptomyces sp. NPDC006324 TaxID=3156751 RepID=UPI0033A8BD96
MTATMVGQLVRAGPPAHLGGGVATPDVRLDQVAAPARRRDLPVLPDRQVPSLPAVRPSCSGRAHRLRPCREPRWIAPVGTVEIDRERSGSGAAEAPLHSGENVALLPVTRPSADRSVGRAPAGGRQHEPPK